MQKFWVFLLSGILFLLTGEFMLFQIRGGIEGLLIGFIFEILILLFTYFSIKLIDKYDFKLKEPVIFLIYGLIGLLFVEWFIAGNSPWANPEASQVIMFSYWAGAIMFIRIFMDKRDKIKKLRKWMLKYFIFFFLIAILIGFILPADMKRGIIVLSMLGYGSMDIFWILYFIKNFKIQKA